MRLSIFILIFASSFLAANECVTQAVVNDLSGVKILNFHLVSDGIYRSAQIPSDQMAGLKSMGVQFDVDLSNIPDDMAEEKKAAAAAGVTWYSEPMSSMKDPDPAQIDRVLAYINDSSHREIIVHCKHGDDRTGLVIGLYRVKYEHWTPEKAWKEMLQYGFKPARTHLVNYFTKVTGYTPPAGD